MLLSLLSEINKDFQAATQSEAMLENRQALSEPMLTCYYMDHEKQTSVKIYSKLKHLHSIKFMWKVSYKKAVQKCCLRSGGHFVLASVC